MHFDTARPGASDSLRRSTVAALLVLALGGCGTGIFPESSEGLGFPGTTPWVKVDQRPDVSDALGIQVVSLAASLGDELRDPCAIALADGSRALYYASSASRSIWRTRAAAGSFEWARGARVLSATESWERGEVRGLSVLEREEGLVAWYGAGAGAGIGRAVSSDGIRWTKEPGVPVLTPSESWEADAVRAPAVARASDGRLWMVYEVGEGAGIGAAWSDDGIEWRRTGLALGRGETGSWDAARVAAPSLRVEISAAGRDVFRVWYEGMAGNDHSIGEAGSYDGTAWTRSPYNPVLAESPPLGLTVGADEREPWVIGEAGSRELWFVARQLDPLAQGIGVARDESS
ncbi:MAG: hypothetical protein IPK07_20765 [Deltaproteobacteria bacterium]|nr:hypothetical protein [Deltaproteobacteria bacterium]